MPQFQTRENDGLLTLRWVQQGDDCLQKGNAPHAFANYQQALPLAAGSAGLQARLGEAALRMGQPQLAVEHLQRALALDSKLAAAATNLGASWFALGDEEQALAWQRRAVEIDSALPVAWLNLGETLRERGDNEEAIAAFDTALRLQPASPIAHYNRALARLASGDLPGGWADYEWRGLAKPNLWRVGHALRWNGNSLAGRTIRVYAEQGLGTELLFASCVSDLMSRAEHVRIECEPRLARLFGRAFPRATVQAVASTSEEAGSDWGKHARFAQPECDFESPLGSLPRVLRSDWGDFPRRRHYLNADPALAQRWRARLAGLKPGLKIGVSWLGGIGTVDQRRRCPHLAEWAGLLAAPGSSWVNVQYGANGAADDEFRAATPQGVVSFADLDARNDLDNLAALLSELDLVITVDNSTAALAAALGTPTWVLLPRAGSWRWFTERNDSPWFASIRLFRQHTRGDWGPVFAATQAALLAHPTRRRSAA